jgi:hypothetical protein
MFDDDFDPSMHTPEEIEAHEADEQAVLAAAQILKSLDFLAAPQAALERLIREDALGYELFGRPWVDDDGRPQPVAPDAWLDAHA